MRECPIKNVVLHVYTCHRLTVWLDSSVSRVLAQYARGPGFEFRSGHVLFPPLWHLVAQCGSVLVLRVTKGLSSVLAWFRADLGANLIKQGEFHRSTVWLGSSVVRVLAHEKSWVRVAVRPFAFSSPVTYSKAKRTLK